MDEVVASYSARLDRDRVIIEHRKYGVVTIDVTPVGFLFPTGSQYTFFEFRATIRAIANAFFLKWEQAQTRPYSTAIGSWVCNRMGPAINHKFYPIWKQALQIHPTTTAVHRALFAAGGPHLPLSAAVFSPRLYENPHLVSDIVRFRSAALAVLNADGILMDRDPSTRRYFSIDESAERIADWRNLLSPDMVAYRSLNRTLNRFPGGVPVRTFSRLCRTRLERPITTRLEAIAALVPTSGHQNFSVFHHATPAQIADAVTRVNALIQRPTNLRSSSAVTRAMSYLIDYPERYHGSLPGLTTRAIEWHQNYERGVFLRSFIDPNTRCALPPFPLPEIEGITFLATAGEVEAESDRMGHCIASYARNAIAGRCFLFHVDYKGEMASIEMNEEGRVVQAQGPRNRPNRAAQWGERQLTQWVKGVSHGDLGTPADPDRPTGRRPIAWGMPQLREGVLAGVG